MVFPMNSKFITKEGFHLGDNWIEWALLSPGVVFLETSEILLQCANSPYVKAVNLEQYLDKLH